MDDLKSLFAISQIELTYKNYTPFKQRLHINTPHKAYQVFAAVWPDTLELREEIMIMLLDQHRHCLGVSSIAHGGMTSCEFDPKLVFATALTGRATSIILAHNHPSGYLQPSQADIDVTDQLCACGQFLQLPIVDHLILSSNGYYSFVDEGMLSPFYPPILPLGKLRLS